MTITQGYKMLYYDLIDQTMRDLFSPSTSEKNRDSAKIFLFSDSFLKLCSIVGLNGKKLRKLALRKL